MVKSPPLTPQQLLETQVNLSVPQFATILNVSRSYGYELVKDGTVKSIRVGERVLVPVSEVQRLLDTGLTQGSAA